MDLCGSAGGPADAAGALSPSQRQGMDKRWLKALGPLRRDLTLSAHWQLVDHATGRRSGLHVRTRTGVSMDPAADRQVLVVL